MRDDGGPAFPTRAIKNVSVDPDTPVFAEGVRPGISHRDYFAAHAPQFPLMEVVQVLMHVKHLDPDAAMLKAATDAAEWAYLYADAMLTRRSM